MQTLRQSPPRPRLLITGGDSPLARAVIAALPAGLTVRAVDTRFADELPRRAERSAGDLRDPNFTASIVRGVSAVLHLAPLTLPFDDDGENLDHATRGTYHLLQAALEAGVGRVAIGSSLGLFDDLPADYDVRPAWRPRPRACPADLCAWLAECLARERARDPGARFTCIRVARDWTAADASALAAHALEPVEEGWRVEHLGRRSPQPAPQEPPAEGRPIRRVVIFGAAGPLAAALARELQDDYTLRLTDLRPIAEVAAANQPQSPGAPLPQALGPPHECLVVDVTDPAQVLEACVGMDAIVNCTVIRREPAGAFRVNALGAYNVMRAAVAHGIRRVVHTGPYQLGREGAAGLNWDTFVVDDAPPRPGGGWDLYFHSKLLGQEICRIFAGQFGLEVPALLFVDFVNPARPEPQADNAFIVSWEDAARALRAALEAPGLPSPYEVLHINADLPHGVFPNDKAKRLLGWQPRDDLRAFWSR